MATKASRVLNVVLLLVSAVCFVAAFYFSVQFLLMPVKDEPGAVAQPLIVQWMPVDHASCEQQLEFLAAEYQAATVRIQNLEDWAAWLCREKAKAKTVHIIFVLTVAGILAGLVGMGRLK